MGKPLKQITFEFSETDEVQEAALPAPEQEPELTSLKEPVADVAVHMKETPSQNSKRGRRSLKDTGIAVGPLNVPEDDILFQKQYYSIGEVALMFNENQSLIRYWETEFDILQPRKNRKGDRYFRPVDIKNLVLIYDLLRRRKFTIEGARDYLKKNKRAEEKFAMIRSLEKIRSFLMELKASL
jgi:DNA-binding transcriptional MerR regulator